MHRFFIPPIDRHTSRIVIRDPDEVHHIVRVLRLPEGTPVVLFDGSGLEATGKIGKFDKRTVEVDITSRKTLSIENFRKIILACAVPKKAKFEGIIEKCTELGVDEIIPLQTQRTDVKFSGDAAVRKARRYQTVAVNAAKQSQRTTVPRIHPVTSFSAVVKALDKSTAAFIPCLEGERELLWETLQQKKDAPSFMFFIGPEGDFTPHEVALAREAGCTPVSLGPLTLKVDTAAVSVVAATRLFLSAHATSR